ncbi:MAG: PH domain-containing protein [Pontimonas sp.]|jgi:membrane protein YdbS with pleckstrin-like domain|nr:PH domain-containing protein [Pontimonas sp.]
MSPEETVWKGISPRYQVEAVVHTVAVSLLPLAGSSVPLWISEPGVSWVSWYPLAITLAIVAIVGAFIPRRIRAYGYALRADDLVFRRGIFFQRQVAVPYGRLQLVDVTRGPLSRLLGLSELKLVTAAASTGVTIPGLPLPVAEELRDQLIAVAETRRAGL